MRRYLSVMFFLCLHITTNCQLEIKNLLSLQQVSDLRNTLDKNIHDTTRVRILLRLAKYHFESGKDKVFLDSAAIRIRSAKEISGRQIPGNWKSIILMYEASLCRRNGKNDSAVLLVNRAITELRALNDQFHVAEAYLELSRCYPAGNPSQVSFIKKIFNTLFQVVPNLIPVSQRDSCMSVLMNFYFFQLRNESYDLSLDFLGHLHQCYQILHDKIHQFYTRKEIADLHYKSGKVDLALDELIQIAREQKEGGYPHICFTYDLLAGLYSNINNRSKELFYALEAVKNVNTAFDSSYLPQFYYRVGYLYTRTGNFTEAADWNTKMLNYLIVKKKGDGIYFVIYDLTNNLVKLQKAEKALNIILDNNKIYPPVKNSEKDYMLQSLVQCYAALHKNSIADKYCDELIRLDQLRVKQKEITSNVVLHQFLANFYLDDRQYEKAEKFFKITVEEWPKHGRDRGALYKSFFLYRLDSAKGKYLSAIQNLRKYQFIKDSINTIDKTKQLEEVKIAYQTEQKDSLINLKEQNIQLLTKQDLLQKGKLNQQIILRNIVLAVVALLIIIMTLLYNRYRQKQKTNRLLNSQKEVIDRSNHVLQQLNEQQTKLLVEKDWLVKEIHHRVKNNLQMVVSLLNAQTEFLTNPSAIDAIKESRERMQAIAIIHQKLYQVDNNTQINMCSYINELIDNIKNSFADSQKIRFETDVADVSLDVAQSVPLGLILNEAITNAVKYAYPENEKGVVQISLKSYNDNMLQLKIADSGKGIPANIDIEHSNSLGIQLIRLFSEQLDGDLYFMNRNGLEIVLNFKASAFHTAVVDKTIA